MSFNYWQKLESDCFYHIYNRAVGEEVLFIDQLDYEFFLKKYAEYLNPYFDTYAYCLIPNHFHYIVKVKSEDKCRPLISEEQTKIAQSYSEGYEELSNFLTDQFRRLFSSFALKHNFRHNRKGPLITPKFKRVNMNNDDRLRYLIAYANYNPIHHGMKSNFTDWKYSSYIALRSEKATLLSRDAVLRLFDGLSEFDAFHTSFKVIKLEENLE